MIYSRIVRSVRRPLLSPVSPIWCTRLFVFGDIMCLNIQSTGGGLTASTNPNVIKIGEHIVVAGLGLQIAIFISFVACCVCFHVRFSRYIHAEHVTIHVPWEAMLNMLYAVSVIISIRNVFRLVEYVMGKGSYLFANEWPVYVFDGALMLLVMVALYVWYPDQLVVNRTESMVELTGQSVGEGREAEIEGRKKDKVRRYFGMGQW